VSLVVRPSSDIAFSPSVKAVQERRGSRIGYAKMEERGGFAVEIGEALAAFIAEQRSFYLATASADGQPYVQHRGGPKGFLRVLDERTSPSTISPATANTSQRAISPRTRRR
jgi:predicted pyridoxine 5'-phosphate oxidase superfamily flavin-nucleotide-binding protein